MDPFAQASANDGSRPTVPYCRLAQYRDDNPASLLEHADHPSAAPQPSSGSTDAMKDHRKSAEVAHNKGKRIVLQVPSLEVKTIPANTVHFEGPLDSEVTSCPSRKPQGAMETGPQPADPRLRPTHPLDDRWSRVPGTLPSASLSVHSDQNVEVKIGFDGNLASETPVPQLHAVGAGVSCHLTRNVDLNAAIRLPTNGRSTDQQGHGGYVGLGLHW